MGAGYTQDWLFRFCEGATGKMHYVFLLDVNMENADVEVLTAMLALCGNWE